MLHLSPHKTPLVSESLSLFLRLRLIEVAGFMVVAGAALVALMLLSYDPLDPSWNTALQNSLSTGHVNNLVGVPGAIIADLALQSLGHAAYAIPLTLAFYGWRTMMHVPLTSSPWRRVAWLTLALALTSMGAAFIAPDTPGGALGWVLRRLWAQTTPGADVVVVAFPLGLTLWLLGFICGLKSIDMSWRTMWQGVGRALASAGQRIFKFWPSQAQTRMRSLSSRGRSAGDALPEVGTWQSDTGLLGNLTAADEDLDPDLFLAPDFRSARPHHPQSAPATPAKTRATRRPSSSSMAASTSGTATAKDAQLPPLALLEAAPPSSSAARKSSPASESRARELESVLEDFGIRGRIVKVRPGPVVTLYELEPAAGIKSSRVISLADDIARSMSAVSARVAIVPGRNVIGIELPNTSREKVYLRELLESPLYEESTAHLALMLGKDIEGNPVLADLARMPHLLLAGTTGSGKSVALNTMILSFLFRLPPDRCKFIMIDPKMLELSVYDGIPHLLAPVVTDPRKAVVALKWVVREMEDRYRAMSTVGVRNIEGYNQKLQQAQENGAVLTRTVQTGFDPETGKPIIEHQNLDMKPLPFIVVIVDEMADLMLVAGKDIENAVQRLAQMARAAGIHLIMATQRPSVDVITGTIKANFPSRISFNVTSKIDSRTILGEQGAEQLLGQGDMLYMASASRITRVHGPYVTDHEIESVVSFLKTLDVETETIDITHDDNEGADASDSEAGGAGYDALYDQAVDLVCRERKASTSYLQRHFQIGYNRAARMIDRMEADGVISASNAVGRREVLAPGRRV